MDVRADIESLKRHIEEGRGSERVVLECSVHGPKDFPYARPGSHCVECWKLYYLYIIGTTPEDKRDVRLSQLESITARQNEMAEKGINDLRIFDHPTIERSWEPD